MGGPISIDESFQKNNFFKFVEHENIFEDFFNFFEYYKLDIFLISYNLDFFPCKLNKKY